MPRRGPWRRPMAASPRIDRWAPREASPPASGSAGASRSSAVRDRRRPSRSTMTRTSSRRSRSAWGCTSAVCSMAPGSAWTSTTRPMGMPFGKMDWKRSTQVEASRHDPVVDLDAVGALDLGHGQRRGEPPGHLAGRARAAVEADDQRARVADEHDRGPVLAHLADAPRQGTALREDRVALADARGRAAVDGQDTLELGGLATDDAGCDRGLLAMRSRTSRSRVSRLFSSTVDSKVATWSWSCCTLSRRSMFSRRSASISPKAPRTQSRSACPRPASPARAPRRS